MIDEKEVLNQMHTMMQESWEPEIGEDFITVYNWLVDCRPALSGLDKLEHGLMFRNEAGKPSASNG